MKITFEINENNEVNYRKFNKDFIKLIIFQHHLILFLLVHQSASFEIISKKNSKFKYFLNLIYLNLI